MIEDRSNIPANTTEAHTIAIYGLVRDMAFVLDKVAMGLLSVVAYFALSALLHVKEGHWFSVAVDVAAGGLLALSCRNAMRRKRRYRIATEARATRSEGS